MLLVAALTVVLSPDRADAHGIGGIRPSNYDTRVTAVRPSVRGITVRAVDLGDRLELTNTTGSDVVVVGYNGEPYLRVGPRGVYENVRSPAVYLNRTRQATAPVPRRADPNAAPVWRRTGDGRTVLWHDHRAHWMGAQDPPEVRRDSSVEHLVQRFTVELRHDGRRIDVAGDVRWVPGPSPWPWVIAAALLAVAIALASRTRVAVPVLGATLGIVAVSETLHLVGSWAGTTVGTATKLGASAYAIGGILISIVALVWLLRRGVDAAAPLVLIAGLFLALAGGLADITVLTRSQLPTTLSGGVARTTVTLALGLGAGLAATGALRLRPSTARHPRARVTTETAAVASVGIGTNRLVTLRAVVALELERRVRDPEPFGEERAQRRHPAPARRATTARRSGPRARRARGSPTRVTTRARGARSPHPGPLREPPRCPRPAYRRGPPPGARARRRAGGRAPRCTTSAAMKSDATESTQSAPNATTAAPATSAPNDPSASEARCQNAPRRLRLAPAVRATTTALPMFTTRPAAATTMTPAPSMLLGACNRSIASTTMNAAAPSSRNALTCAPITSARTSPYVWRSEAGAETSRWAISAIASAATSDTMWTPSASSARDPNAIAAPTSTTRKAAFAPRAIQRARRRAASRAPTWWW